MEIRPKWPGMKAGPSDAMALEEWPGSSHPLPGPAQMPTAPSSWNQGDPAVCHPLPSGICMLTCLQHLTNKLQVPKLTASSYQIQMSVKKCQKVRSWCSTECTSNPKPNVTTIAIMRSFPYSQLSLDDFRCVKELGLSNSLVHPTLPSSIIKPSSFIIHGIETYQNLWLFTGHLWSPKAQKVKNGVLHHVPSLSRYIQHCKTQYFCAFFLEKIHLDHHPLSFFLGRLPHWSWPTAQAPEARNWSQRRTRAVALWSCLSLMGAMEPQRVGHVWS